MLPNTMTWPSDKYHNIDAQCKEIKDKQYSDVARHTMTSHPVINIIHIMINAQYHGLISTYNTVQYLVDVNVSEV